MHTHITNTRIGDVEILERRYPVLLHEFSIRKGSGGVGKFNGGDGVVRDIEFLESIQVSILSEVCTTEKSHRDHNRSSRGSHHSAGFTRHMASKVEKRPNVARTYGSSNFERRMATYLRRRRRLRKTSTLVRGRIRNLGSSISGGRRQL